MMVNLEMVVAGNGCRCEVVGVRNMVIVVIVREVEKEVVVGTGVLKVVLVVS